MKKLLFILLIVSAFTASAQYSQVEIIGSDTLCSKDSSPDSTFWVHNGVYTFYVKYPSRRFIPMARITGLTAALSAKAAATDLSSYVPATRTINGVALSSNVTILSNVDNTSDANKPVSTAQQTALNLKVNISDTSTMLSKYLRKQDTTAMLSPYVRANVAAATYQPLGTYATGSGSATGTNTGDNAANSTYASDYRAANFVAGTNYLAPNGNGSGLTGLTASQVGLANVTNTSDANKPVSTAQQTALDLKANLSTTPQIVASINATAQTANIATATLYAVPSAGFYRVSIYITITSVGTTSTMPSTTITYTDGNSGTNAHSTTTTATNASNSLTTSFAQATYVLYAKASTNIQYATGSYASTGTPMQYALRIRVEAL